MPPFGNEPDWTTPGDTSNVTAPAQSTTVGGVNASVGGGGGGGGATGGGGGGGGGFSNDSDGGRIKCILVMTSCLNFTIAVMMATLGVLTLLEFDGGSSLTDIAATPFLASYMILFAVLLFFYELMWWMPVPKINIMLRKNFGFMYGLKGKGLYMIFVAFLCLGLMDDSSQMVKMLGWATGIAFLATGVWHFFLVLSNPDFMDAYRPPTAGLERMSATGEMQQGENVV